MSIDLDIQNYIHTSDGMTVDWLDLGDEYDKLRGEQRKLPWKKKGRTTGRNNVGVLLILGSIVNRFLST